MIESQLRQTTFQEKPELFTEFLRFLYYDTISSNKIGLSLKDTLSLLDLADFY
jgi:hypothetical protein